jgi:hypothetical protein
MKVYATVPLLHGGGKKEFEPGDLIEHDYAPEALAKLIAWGHASTERPPGVRHAYCLVEYLSYQPHPGGFRRGDRISDVMPAALVRTIVARGDASYEPPAGVRPAYAVEPLSYRPHGVGVDFAAGDRVDGRVPDGILSGWIETGHVSRGEPGSTKRPKA